MIGHSLRGFAREWRKPGKPVTPREGLARMDDGPLSLEQAAV
jgi:hypothetical protein